MQDFRSPGGLYEQIEARYALPDPSCLFDATYIRLDQKPFFEFAQDLLPSADLTPSASHRFIRALEERGKVRVLPYWLLTSCWLSHLTLPPLQLLRVYTQNIDGLELRAGISRVVQWYVRMLTQDAALRMSSLLF